MGTEKPIEITVIKLNSILLFKRYALYSIISLFTFGGLKRRIKSLRYKLINTKFSCIFSLGDRCATAQILNRTNLRTYSSPFDWIIGGSLCLRIDLIISRFFGFLRRENLIIRNEIDNHGKFRVDDLKYGFRFLHDFPSPDIDLSYQIVFEKYQRRIQRIYDKSYQGNVLVCYIETCSDCIDSTQILINKIKYLKNALQAKHLTIFYCHARKAKDNEQNHSRNLKKYALSDNAGTIYKLNINLGKDYSSTPLPKEITKTIFKSLYHILENN